MKWVILSTNPAALHATIESAQAYSKIALPFAVAIVRDPETYKAFELVTRRLKVQIHPVETLDGTVSDILMLPRENGTLEAMSLITLDTMLFIREPKFNVAWATLRDDYDMLGVDVMLDRHTVPADGHGLPWYFWKHEQHKPFRFGTVYRTADILGPLSSAAFDAPVTLLHAMNRDTSFFRRARMACLDTPAIVYYPSLEDYPRATAVSRYLGGEIIDRSNPTTWKPYKS